MVGHVRAGSRGRLKAWIAGVSASSMVLGTLVGVAAVGGLVLAGPVGSAQADPPPSDPPTSITLASTASTFGAGSSATLTATTDEDVADTSSIITITDETTSTTLTTCASGTICSVPVSFLTGDPHSYVATVNGLTSNEVTVGRATWSISLAVDDPTIAAGASATLTATANQDIGNAEDQYTIRIYDQTTGETIQSCHSGFTCSGSTQFATGPTHTYVADVSAGYYPEVYGTETDVQATSGVVSVSREAWTIDLTSNESTFVAGSSFTLTATTNQDISGAGSSYAIRIYDETTGEDIGTCHSGTTCSVSTNFLSGGAHTYIADVAAGYYPEDYGTETDIQASSNEVTVARAAWAVTLTENATTFAAGSSVTLTATANQDTGGTFSSYSIRIYDETTGENVGTCNVGATCSATTQFVRGSAHTYIADIAAGAYPKDYGTETDVQAVSGTVTASREPWTLALTEDRTVFSAG